MVYNCDNVVLEVDILVCLCDECFNFVGFKDGIGDIGKVCQIIVKMGDCLIYLGGMFMVELFVEVYLGVGFMIYLLVVFNFVFVLVNKFYVVLWVGDIVICEQILNDFFYLFMELCNCCKGYVVFVIKVGVCLVGFEVGVVCVFFLDLIVEEEIVF